LFWIWLPNDQEPVSFGFAAKGKSVPDCFVSVESFSGFSTSANGIGNSGCKLYTKLLAARAVQLLILL
jgi:hypothetical protein